MRTPKILKPAKARALQPLLTWTARRNARVRELAAMMRLSCVCGAPLSAHIGAGNRWRGCPTTTTKDGTR